MASTIGLDPKPQRLLAVYTHVTSLPRDVRTPLGSESICKHTWTTLILHTSPLSCLKLKFDFGPVSRYMYSEVGRWRLIFALCKPQRVCLSQGGAPRGWAKDRPADRPADYKTLPALGHRQGFRLSSGGHIPVTTNFCCLDTSATCRPRLLSVNATNPTWGHWASSPPLLLSSSYGC